MPDPEPNEILNVVRQFRSALARKDAIALNRLIDAYGRIYNRLQDKITLLMDAIEMEAPTVGQLTRMTRYKALIAQVEDELTGYQAILRDTIDGVSRDAITYASRDTARLLRTMGVQAGFNRLPNDAIQTLLGFLAPDSPLYERIGQLAGYHAESVAQKIVEGVGLGNNPRVIASAIRDELGGGLTDALRMTRTVQLWSYREASRANYLANSDVVDGWVWSSARDDRTCEACLAMDGTIHGLDETLDGHYNCRCAPVPIVAGFPPVVTDTGEEWFNQQSEAYQREALGPGKYDAWKEGKFEFSQLATKREDAVYGQMTNAATLKE
jgi:SPP1 gp7 family putative phage head morphogenesis protein